MNKTMNKVWLSLYIFSALYSCSELFSAQEHYMLFLWILSLIINTIFAVITYDKIKNS
jgi:hypothetical protein